MSYRNLLGPFRQPSPLADFMDGMKNVRAKVPVSTHVADADYYILQNDEPVFVFERLPFNSPLPHDASTIFTAIPIHNSDSSFRGDFVNRNNEIPAATHNPH